MYTDQFHRTTAGTRPRASPTADGSGENGEKDEALQVELLDEDPADRDYFVTVLRQLFVRRGTRRQISGSHYGTEAGQRSDTPDGRRIPLG